MEAKSAKFPLGRTVATPGALEALKRTGESPEEFFARHVTGDWGELCEEDRSENAFALEHGLRLLSSYRTKAGEKLWVITEWDRSVAVIWNMGSGKPCHLPDPSAHDYS